MREIAPLVERLARDTVVRLGRAAKERFVTAEILRPQRQLAALYLYGYSTEMCLTSAYFRSAGFSPNAPIDRDTRQRRMAQARQLRTPRDGLLMNSDPHPLVGWARFLEWQRSASAQLSESEMQRLREAINKAVLIYNYWRPELRYKTLEIMAKQLEEVRRASRWFIENYERL
jgi:hypothetical protein